jgi:hypothetical protein
MIEKLNADLKTASTERAFYFSKLRDVEVLVQYLIENKPEVAEDATLIQNILYAAEDQKVEVDPTTGSVVISAAGEENMEA